MAEKIDVGKFEDYLKAYTPGEIVLNFIQLAGRYNKLVELYNQTENQLLETQFERENDRQRTLDSWTFGEGSHFGY